MSFILNSAINPAFTFREGEGKKMINLKETKDSIKENTNDADKKEDTAQHEEVKYETTKSDMVSMNTMDDQSDNLSNFGGLFHG